jgi:3-hydroxypropanoate dehydrogenase
MRSGTALDKVALDVIFINARTRNDWLDQELRPGLLEEMYELARMGPTANNCQPMRVVFVTTPQAKERLHPALSPGNVDKTMAAPATALFAYDTRFYDQMPRLFPHVDVDSWLGGNDSLIESIAFRNATLQAAYFMIAARALGVDCGPMSGFDSDAVNKTFFPNGQFKVNFICNLGYGTGKNLFPRAPRLEFSDACAII